MLMREPYLVLLALFVTSEIVKTGIGPLSLFFFVIVEARCCISFLSTAVSGIVPDQFKYQNWYFSRILLVSGPVNKFFTLLHF